MATTATTASDSPSHYSTDSSLSRSRLSESSSWMPSVSDAILDLPSPSLDYTIPQHISHFDHIPDKKPVWNISSSSSSAAADVAPVMGAAESWPALSLSAWPSSSNKSPSSDSSKPLSDGSSSSQAGGTPLDPTSNANINVNANASTASTTAATSSQNQPFRRTTNTSSSSSNISNAAPLNTRDHNHSQRGGSYGSGTFRNSHRNRNSSSYPRVDGPHHGNRRNPYHGNQTGFSHRNYSGRDLHLQPQRGIGMMRPPMLMGPPSFPASTAQYMAAPHIGSYGGGPTPYSDYAPHVFMPSPEHMPLVGHFPPPPMYLPRFDPMLYNKILTQVEYYFSADNLSRDEHLRIQMNDEGWVPVRVIAGFRRLAELTNNIQIILEALRSSQVVEIKGETLRRRGDWDKYLMPREASNSGQTTAASNNASLGSQLESMTLSERSREGE